MENLEHIKSYLDAANTICLVAHIHPDGDAIGSVGAMYHFLKEIGKEVYMILPDLQETFNFLPNIHERIEAVPFDTYDLLICLDTSNTERLSITPEDMAKAKNVIVIDHHRNNTIQADISIIDENSPATCEIMYDIIKNMGYNISKDIAEYMYMGIMTDTGSFNYERTSPKTYKIAGELIELGADYVRTCKILNHTCSEAKMRLIADVITNMESYLDGKLRIGVIEKSTIDSVDASDEDASNLVDYLRCIKNTIVAVYFRALDENNYKVSVRAEEPIDASELSIIFGGGGHKRAAGFSTDDLDGTKIKLIEILERLLKSENNRNT